MTYNPSTGRTTTVVGDPGNRVRGMGLSRPVGSLDKARSTSTVPGAGLSRPTGSLGTSLSSGITYTGRLTPYKGYSLRSVRDLFSRIRQKRISADTPERSAPTNTTTRSRYGMAPSRSYPKRLWDYQLTSLAPSHTTLGRVRTMVDGFNSPFLR